MKITKKELRQIIIEEVYKLQKKTILESRKSQIQKELQELQESSDVHINGDTEFKVGDEIENSGNDGELFDMDSDQPDYVERRGDISGEIIGIKDGYYILKATGDSKKFIDTFRVRIGYPYYRKKKHADEKGQIKVDNHNELLSGLKIEYGLYNIEKTGREDNWYYWTKEDEDMVGAYFPEEGEMWYKPMSKEKKAQLWDRPMT